MSWLLFRSTTLVLPIQDYLSLLWATGPSKGSSFFFFKDPSIRNEMAHTHTRQDQSCVTPDSLGNEPSRLETKAGPSSLFLPLSFSALLAFWCQGCWTTSAESKQYTHQEQIFSFLIFVYFFCVVHSLWQWGVCLWQREESEEAACYHQNLSDDIWLW